MELFDIIEKRRSIRAYQKRELPESVLLKVMESARLAQSANNVQPWKFIIIKDEQSKQDMVDICKGKKWVADASAIIAAVATNPDYRMGNGRPSSDIDLSIALTQISLAAVDQSLGTCWIGSFRYDDAMKYLGIPKNYTLVSLMTLGYPAELPPPKKRKTIDEIILHERWSE